MTRPSPQEIEKWSGLIFIRLHEIFRNVSFISLFIYLGIIAIFTNMTVVAGEISSLTVYVIATAFFSGLVIYYFIIMDEIYVLQKNGLFSDENIHKSKKHSKLLFAAVILHAVVVFFIHVATEALSAVLVFIIYIIYILLRRHFKAYYTSDY